MKNRHYASNPRRASGFGIACEMGSAEKSRKLFANVQLACRIGLLLLAFRRFVAGKSNEINGT